MVVFHSRNSIFHFLPRAKSSIPRIVHIKSFHYRTDGFSKEISKGFSFTELPTRKSLRESYKNLVYNGGAQIRLKFTSHPQPSPLDGAMMVADVDVGGCRLLQLLFPNRWHYSWRPRGLVRCLHHKFKWWPLGLLRREFEWGRWNLNWASGS